jgi:organic radical activating enzyme
MPQPPTLKIIKIFPSLQGEGLRQGEATIFIRFSGCNLTCSFCDTKYAWRGGRLYQVEDILEKIERIKHRFPAWWVCLTGGEPLLQDVRQLVLNLKRKGFKIQVETNATIYRFLPVDWYSVSPKPEKYFYQPEYREKAKEVKIVVTKHLRFEVVQRIRQDFPPKTPLLLQPQSNRKWSLNLSLKLLNQALRENLNNIRVSGQLHKFFGLR